MWWTIPILGNVLMNKESFLFVIFPVNNNLKDVAWRNAVVIEGYDASRVRQDACGAWIAYDDFNNCSSMFGWEIDHIYPIDKLKLLNVPEKLWNAPLNLRALHWKNNYSKGTSYPMYTAAVIGYGDTNMEQKNVFWVSDPLQDSLRGLFKIKE